MTFDYKDYAGRKKEEKRQRRAASLELLTRAEVPAKALVGDPKWDIFLSQVQVAIEQSEAQAAGLEAKLADPDVVNHDQIMAVKTSLARVKGRIEAWKAAVELPAQIVSAAEAERDLVAELDEETRT